MEPNELYGLPLERFTEERNALARELRRAGRREESTNAARLPKPSLAAWAVNQLVRTQRREVSDLLGAGDALRAAQAALLDGRGNADALRDAVENERVARERLTNRARGLLSSEGHELSPATLSKVSETLNAAALDDDARAKVEHGCLVRELHHVGLGTLEAGTPARSAKSTRPPSKQRASPRAGRRPVRATHSEMGAAQKAEAEARRRDERTTRDLAEAKKRRDRAARVLRQAEEALHDAEQAHASAKEAVVEAASELEKLRGRQN
jgi:hypothetical protein